MRVLGVDPGGTTGLCILDCNVDEPKVWLVESHQLGLKETFRWLHDDLPLLAVNGIGIERFTFTPRTMKLSAQYDAVYVIGAVLSFAVNNELPIRLQSPANAKTAYQNDHLQELGISVKGPHAKDAARHSLLYIRTVTNRV